MDNGLRTIKSSTTNEEECQTCVDVCLSRQRLEGEKEALERDLSFKADQARQYDSLLEAVRENNRQLQVLHTHPLLVQHTCFQRRVLQM